jgi:hypothetical protein
MRSKCKLQIANFQLQIQESCGRIPEADMRKSILNLQFAICNLQLLLLPALCLVFLPATVRAHSGPPFPLLVDEKAGPYKVSVWADPDIGTGTFFVFVESPDGGQVDDVAVKVSVVPTSGRLPEATYQATAREAGRRVQHVAEVLFDAQEYWQVRFQVSGPAGKGELSAEVEATPPGLGVWDFALYLFPFVLLAGLWVYGMLRYRHRRQSTTPGRTALLSRPARPDGSGEPSYSAKEG